MNAEDLNIVWAPQPGSQTLFMSCPIFECLYEGTRGPGKTDALLMSFAQFCNQGFGIDWRGILFRQTYKQLEDVVTKTKKWFPQFFPEAVFNKGDMKWVWPDGEELLLRYMDNPDDYWNYHGHAYPWIGWEELTNWPDLSCYESMKSCCRSTAPGVPRMYRATCNPYGVGHHAVKNYFIDVAPPGVVYYPPKLKHMTVEPRPRVRIHGSLYENKILMDNDPDYVANIESITDPAKRAAWLYGRWDIVAGGAFSDLWRREINVIPRFAIPEDWTLYRSYDDGDSKPFSVGWWAVADGTEIELEDGRTFCPPPGSIIRIHEWYGWTGEPNDGSSLGPDEIAEGIKEREQYLLEMGMIARLPDPGPADNAIFDKERTSKSVADLMEDEGVTWEPSNKKPGSRIAGVKAMRQLLKATKERKKDKPHFYVFNHCSEGFIRTVPTLPRDKKKMDDVDTNAEDHTWDETRYAILFDPPLAENAEVVGF